MTYKFWAVIAVAVISIAVILVKLAGLITMSWWIILLPTVPIISITLYIIYCVLWYLGDWR